MKYIICCFTGKAVARIKQIFGGNNVNAMTLHMLLAKGPGLIGKVDYLIIDEISMVPNALLAQVLIKLMEYTADENWATRDSESRALLRKRNNLSVVMVGDASQIASIEPGNLCCELLRSNIPKIQLMTDHRVKTDGVLKSNTVQFAKYTYSELAGIPPERINFEFGKDCTFLEGAIAEIESVIRSYASAGGDQKDLVVISPYNAPLDELNERISEIFLPNAQKVADCRGKIWKVGAKLMCQRNFYDPYFVMNGEEGLIRRIEGDKLIVSFEGRTDIAVPLATDAIDEQGEMVDEKENWRFDEPLNTRFLAYSYAITIHKSQGSEWETVLAYLPANFKSSFLSRNLFYTAISRAKERLYIVGSSASTVDMIVSSKPTERYDNLSKRLKHVASAVPLLTN